MPKDNRDKIENDPNLNEILNDDSPIAEDVDPADHDGEIDAEDIDPNVPESQEDAEEAEEVVEEDPEEIDYKKKFSASSREATTQYFKNKKLVDTIDKASVLPDPTIEELRVYAKEQGSDFDELDAFAQNILKKTLVNERRFEMIHATSTESKAIDDWADKVDSFSNSPDTVAKYPDVVENDVEFKKYCMKESRRGMDLQDLVASFLFGMGDKPIKKAPRPKKDMLLAGGGSQGGTPKPKQLTAEELRVIRSSNPARYKILVKEGKAGLDLLDRE